MTAAQKAKIETFKTEKQLREYLKKENISIYKDNTKEMKSTSIWTDKYTRIYKLYKRKNFIVQMWESCNITLSPQGKSFFNNPNYLKNL